MVECNIVLAKPSLYNNLNNILRCNTYLEDIFELNLQVLLLKNRYYTVSQVHDVKYLLDMISDSLTRTHNNFKKYVQSLEEVYDSLKKKIITFLFPDNLLQESQTIKLNEDKDAFAKKTNSLQKGLHFS